MSYEITRQQLKIERFLGNTLSETVFPNELVTALGIR